MRQSRVSLASASVERRTGSRKPMWQTHVVELRRLNGQAGLDIAQALPVGQLGKRHGPILLGAGENPHPMVAAVTGDNPPECRPRHKIHELREKCFARVHGRLHTKTRETALPLTSSRHRPSSPANPINQPISKTRPFS